MRLKWAGLSVPDFGSLTPIVPRKSPSDMSFSLEFLDQAMRIEPGRTHHGSDAAPIVEQNLPFRQIEIERLAFGAREDEAGIGAP